MFFKLSKDNVVLTIRNNLINYINGWESEKKIKVLQQCCIRFDKLLHCLESSWPKVNWKLRRGKFYIIITEFAVQGTTVKSKYPGGHCLVPGCLPEDSKDPFVFRFSTVKWSHVIIKGYLFPCLAGNVCFEYFWPVFIVFFEYLPGEMFGSNSWTFS